MELKTEKNFDELIRVSRELSSGKPLPQLFQGVIDIICKFTEADGGTLYIYDGKQNTLKAVLLTNFSLNLHSVVSEFDPLVALGFIEVPLTGDSGQSAKISASAFLTKRIIAIEDVKNNNDYDFDGVRAFDKQNNYDTKRIIAFPLIANNDSIGVLQVINPRHECLGDSYLEFLEILCGQIAISLNNAILIKEGENLLGAIVEMIGMAIDEKSPHTAGHCYRVTEITMMLADAVTKEKDGPYAAFHLSDTEREELRMAALLHDVGKVITPTHILEKSTKLYSLTDRIELLINRFYMWTIADELQKLKQAVIDAGRHDILEVLHSTQRQTEQDVDFLNSINKGLIVMNADNMTKLNEISSRVIQMPEQKPSDEKMILKDDLSNLQTFRGTLNPEERKIMEDHVNSSIRLLSSIPWPNKFARLVEYAAHHHEKMDGSGYPNKINSDCISIPARILGIADRFEGMSAPDRPYRSRKMTLSQVLRIMNNMSQDGEIDPALYDIFLRSKIYLTYGQKYLDDSLIDCS